MKWNRPSSFVQDPEEQANWDSIALYLDTLANTPSAGGPPTGAAGGDLAGTYPNPTVKASVALTGTPTVPTAAPGTNTTQAASTAYADAAVGVEASARSTAVTSEATTRANADALLAPLASPTFTGDPKAPTPTVGDNDTSIATTAFVQTAIAPSFARTFALMGC